MTNNPDTNAAYRKRASKRRRTLGPDALADIGAAQLAEMAKDRARAGRRQYRYTDLQGEDRTNMLRMVRDCALAAMTTFEIAQHFGVSAGTLNIWVMKDPEFAVALRMARVMADERVEQALYHRAVGYSFQSEEVKIHDDGRVTRTPIIKHIPPEVGAATFWLKNRRGDVWRDKVDVSGSVDVNVTDKAQDPRTLAMAVLDTLQQAIYAKLPVTIDGEPAVATEAAAAYAEADLENMSPEEIAALFEADKED